MKELELLVDGFIVIAKKGGALSASCLLFGACIILLRILWRWKEIEHVETRARFDAWNEASRAEEHQTQAINKMADGLRMVSEAQQTNATQISILVALIKDRQRGRDV